MKNSMRRELFCSLNLPMTFIPLFCIFLIRLQFIFPIIDAQPFPYVPHDNLLLWCGYSGNHSAPRNRTWVGDIDSKYFPVDQNASYGISPHTKAQNAPYGFARLSHKEFSYTIPVNPGPKFIRLYFYANNDEINDANFNRSKGVFSVKTNQFTVLNNFSPALTADAQPPYLEWVMKEFCVTVEKSNLNITFTPTSSISDAYAFINGIEVVSMPTNLSYPDPQFEYGQGIPLVGQEWFFLLGNNTALETAYRINIGGKAISPEEDTGLFRKWDDEIIYLTEDGVSVMPVSSTTAKLQFTAIPAYTAPEEVYKTARSTGSYFRNAIMRYNLTWEFPVDNGFNYLVRLHFCEIVSQMKYVGDRVFNIFLANQSAETRFDIIRHSNGTSVPYKQDYVVSMKSRDGEKKVNLSVVLQPISDASISRYPGAILNGIEIFKINTTGGDLGPTLVSAPPSQHKNGTSYPIDSTLVSPPPGQHKKSTSYLTGIVGGVVSGAVMLSIIAFLVLRHGRKVNNSETNLWDLISLSKVKSTKTKGSSMLLDTCRYFSLAQIRAATNNFHETNLIGVGGFGNVYKGYIDGGVTPIAIKRQKPESSQGAHEFKTEIEMLSHLRHRHIVSLIGYCDDHREMILVYEYMERGTLSNHLYNTDKPPLSWEERLQICIGAALGLHYLHFGAKQRIIHRDVKSTNILLDKKWVAKVSDFGLSKVSHMSKSHVSTAVKGSIGYLDPEYYKRRQLTEKSDVYSFGVVLCEVLCGRPPVDPNVERRQMNLAEWFRWCYHDGTIDEIVDPQIKGKIEADCLLKYSEIAFSCLLDDGAERPSMKDVASSLELSLQLQRKSNEPATGMNGEDEVPGCSLSWNDASGSVFSEIIELNAR